MTHRESNIASAVGKLYACEEIIRTIDLDDHEISNRLFNLRGTLDKMRQELLKRIEIK